MAVVVERVMNMVRDEIQKRPEITTQELFEKAKKVDRGMNSLTIRQFNATYPLQVRRTMAPRRRRGPGVRTRMAEAANRDQVRVLLLEFAREVAAADTAGALVDVIGNLDGWVDRVVASAGIRRRRRRSQEAMNAAAAAAAEEEAPRPRRGARKKRRTR